MIENQFKTTITYFMREGRENMRECMQVAFSAAVNHGIEKVVIFTAEGQGVRLAIDEFLNEPPFSKIRVVAVTFPAGKRFTDAEGNPLVVEVPNDLQQEMQHSNIPIVRAHLPFDPIAPTHKSRGVLGQDLSLVENALNIFGGSMSLCVQAVLLACDAGEVSIGEHIVAMTSDTAILAQAASTSDMLTGLVVREILCKPVIFSIGRGESSEQLTMQLDRGDIQQGNLQITEHSNGKVLPPE